MNGQFFYSPIGESHVTRVGIYAINIYVYMYDVMMFNITFFFELMDIITNDYTSTKFFLGNPYISLILK